MQRIGLFATLIDWTWIMGKNMLKSNSVGIRNPTIRKTDPFKNRTFGGSDFEWSKWQNCCNFVTTIWKPDHSKTGLRSTIRNPEMSGFQIPTVSTKLQSKPVLNWKFEKNLILWITVSRSSQVKKVNLTSQIKLKQDLFQTSFKISTETNKIKASALQIHFHLQ